MFIAAKLRTGVGGGLLLVAAAGFAAGASGAWLAAGAARSGFAPAVRQGMAAAQPVRSAHPAEVLRVIDGDTFEARVHIWPGMDVTTKVRLRGIDAAEMHARCDDERTRAYQARDALARILAEGEVGVSGVSQDKYGGRVDADVSTAKTSDVSEAMLRGGYARAYAGGHRDGWCG